MTLRASVLKLLPWLIVLLCALAVMLFAPIGTWPCLIVLTPLLLRGSLRERAVKFWPWAAAAFSGLLLSLCFHAFNLNWLCWIALTPLLCALWFSPRAQKRHWLRCAGLAQVTGTVFFCITFRWLDTVTGLMQPHFLGMLALFGLDCYMALYFALWGWFMGCVAFTGGADSPRLLSSRHNLWLGVLGGAAWAGQEWLRGVVFTGFGWNNLGVPLHGLIPLIQITDLTGVAGLSFLVAMGNVIAVVTVRRFMLEARIAKLRAHFDFTLTVALVGLVFAYGVRRMMLTPPSTPLRVAAVQANIPQDEKFDDAFEQKIFTRYTALTNAAIASNPQLLLWPEVATPRGVFADQTDYRFVMDLAQKTDANFLLGSLDFDEKGDYNIAILFTGRGAEMQSYRKIHLVPFGEYIPFRHSFPLFANLAGNLVEGDFMPGTEFTVLHMRNPDIPVAPLICFEDTLGDLTRQFVLRGARLLVNITNDGWFLHSVQSEQHVANAVFRSAETHLPMIRCSNTGVTCFIDANGRVGQTLRNSKGEPWVQGVLIGEVKVPDHPPLTFYVRHGEWFAQSGLALALGVVVLHAFRRRRSIEKTAA